MIFLGGLLCAAACSKMGLPRIIGMLLAGIIMGPHVLGLLDRSILSVSADLRQMALVIILLKAGLSLDVKSLKQVGRPAFLMTFVPASFEILAFVLFAPPILNEAATMYGIAIAHSCFNILCTALLLPCSGLLEKLVNWLVPGAKVVETTTQLDERLLATPPVALERCHTVAVEMACDAALALKEALQSLDGCTPELASDIRLREDTTDREEDALSTYMLKLSAMQTLGDRESEEVTELLKLVGDFERIADHAVNILESAEELAEKKLAFSDAARGELSVLRDAVTEVLDTAREAFERGDVRLAMQVEPLEQVIDQLKERMRTNHIMRLKNGDCSIETGFVLSDILTNLERVSDHCSNIAGCVIDLRQHNLNLHASLQASRSGSEEYLQKYHAYASKYALPAAK